jgi:hypothetical protein
VTTGELTAWLSAFLLTQAVETPIYARCLRNRRLRFAWAFGASTWTHPCIFLLLPRIWPGDTLTYVACAEAVAVGGEAIYLAALGVSRSVAWALLANAASLGVGLISRALFQWP